MRDDDSPCWAPITNEESQEERALRAVRISQMKAEPKKAEAKEDPHETQKGKKADALTDAGARSGGTHSAAKLLLLALFGDLDQWGRGHYKLRSSLPNGLRLSCGRPARRRKLKWTTVRAPPGAQHNSFL